MSAHRRTLALVIAALALIAAACSSDSDDASVVAGDEVVEEESPADADPAGGTPLQVTSVDFSTGVATVTNTGTEEYDITGHWICNRPEYAELPSEVLEPGATVELTLGSFSADGGEVAIYTSSNFDGAEDIVTYVGWGNGGGRQSVAENAEIWSGDTVQPSGEVITLSGDPGSAAGWTG